MKCIIPSQNVKILARAIHSLAKIGDEVYIDSTEDELILRTINTAKSAFSEFRMCRSFFSTYNFSPSQTQEPCCKVTMKSCINVFKSTHGVDKQVENCEIRIKPDNPQVIFELKFNNSVKKHYLPVIENDQLEAAIPAEAPNQLCASSKFLAAALKNFRQSEVEVSLAVTPEKITIKNHLELRRDANLMRTELSYQQTEFENYVVGNPTNVTFCLKELRAVIMFAEPSNLPVLISFSEPGRPIVFQVQNHPAYEANYIVSTLEPSHLNRTNRGRTSISKESSSPLAIKTSSAEGTKRTSSEAGYTFEEEKSIKEPFGRSKISGKRSRSPVSYSPSPGPSQQKDLTSHIFSHSPEKSSRIVSSPSRAEPRNSEGTETPGVFSPQPGTSKQVDSYFSRGSILSGAPGGIVSESEASMTQSSVASVCRVNIQGMDTSSQPPSELLTSVFSRCFSTANFLETLVGNDAVLEENSDLEHQ